MHITKLTSREFNIDTAGAKRAANEGPVYITDRGRPAYVLLSMAEYERLIMPEKRSMADMLAMPGAEDIDFEPPRLDAEFKPADLD